MNNKLSILTLEDRIKYYFNKDSIKEKNNNLPKTFSFDTVIEYKKNSFQEKKENNYINDLEEIFSTLDNNTTIPVQIGDGAVKSGYHAFCKAREIGDKRSILLKLNSKRHWKFDIESHDTDWSSKKNDVVWRGVTTGKSQRENLVRKFHKFYNIGFSSILSHKKDYIEKELVKGFLSIEEQLKNKFIISLEGNDVATNLKWILASNSVPIMPLPKKESWLMEGLLKPYIHFIPINDDYSNLNDVLEWAKNNDSHCEEISKNGATYMQQFSDHQSEIALQRDIIKRYISITNQKEK